MDQMRRCKDIFRSVISRHKLIKHDLVTIGRDINQEGGLGAAFDEILNGEWRIL
jgi:hypothetical protein